MKFWLTLLVAMLLSQLACAAERCPELPKASVIADGPGWQLVRSSRGLFVRMPGPRLMTAEDAHRISLAHRDQMKGVHKTPNLGSGVFPDLGIQFVSVSVHDFGQEEARVAAELAEVFRADSKAACILMHLVEMKNVVPAPTPR